MVWLADESKELGSFFRLTPLDISKVKAAYGCPDQIGNTCYHHIEAAEGTISSLDTQYQGCTLLISAPHGSVRITTTKFQFSDCSQYIRLYSGSSVQASGLQGHFCSGNKPTFFRMGRYAILDFSGITDSSMTWEFTFTADIEPGQQRKHIFCLLRNA